MLNQRRRRRAIAGWLLIAALHATAATLNLWLALTTVTWPPALIGIAAMLLTGWSLLNALPGGAAQRPPTSRGATPPDQPRHPAVTHRDPAVGTANGNG